MHGSRVVKNRLRYSATSERSHIGQDPRKNKARAGEAGVKKNNTAIDYLRAFVIVLVLAFHAILAYVSFAPSATPAFASMPYFWAPFPIVDSQRWKGFDLFALFSD